MERKSSFKFRFTTALCVFGIAAFLIKLIAPWCENRISLCDSQSFLFGISARFGDLALLFAFLLSVILAIVSAVRKQRPWQYLIEAVVALAVVLL